MRRIVMRIIMAAALGVFCTAMARAADDLARDFASPPDASRMWVWWYWFGAPTTPEAVTGDLEQFKAQGIGGATVFSVVDPNSRKGGDFMSPPWRQLFKHTLREADRLGLGIGMNLCSSWNAGGPWITPELACKKFTVAQLKLKGPRQFAGKLPLPPADERLYRDIAVQAVRLPAPLGAPQDAQRTELIKIKTVQDSFGSVVEPIVNVCAAPDRPLPELAPDQVLKSGQVVDLTGKLAADGTLRWAVPAGDWAILRLGYTLTGKTLPWPAPGGEGLEGDPLSPAAMERQFAAIGKPLAEDAGPLAGRVFQAVGLDSWETGLLNWSERLLKEFQRRRGYDPRRYLPALAGYTVDSSEVTDRFLYDYRLTLGDCVADYYYGRLTELATRYKLKHQSQAAGICYPKWMAMDGLKNLGRCDMPMGEFWYEDQNWLEGKQTKNGKQTASAAHIYGKRLAAAEAFTSNLNWHDCPETLKSTADRSFCEGFNSLFIQASASTIPGEKAPGSQYIGIHYDRRLTWWNQSGAFARYIARCQHLLRQGLFAADVLYYNGDGCPNFVQPKHVDPALGAGYDYDVCNAEVLLTRLAVKDGRLVLPDGMHYRLLVLPERQAMPLEVVRKLKALVEAGATVVGPRPQKATGLKNFPRCDRQVQDLAAGLWGKVDGRTVTQRAAGKGRIIEGRPLREILLADGVAPDFEYAGGGKETAVDFIHRTSGPAEIYFLANLNPRAEKLECTFRVAGKQPELWDPVSGAMREAAAFKQSGGRTTLPLELAPRGSLFVVFRKPVATGEAGHGGANFSTFSLAQTLGGAWTVQFDPRWGGPQSVSFEKLQDWTTRPEEGIRHYSGTATYRTKFESPAPEPHARFFLDLGEVKNVATVRLNGQKLGVVWCAPWRVEVTKSIKAGTNALEIEVVNLWTNRLIGDAALPPEKRLTQTSIEIKKEDPLLPSGLLGPVTLQVAAGANGSDRY